MAIGHARIAERKPGCDAGRSLEVRERRPHALLGALVPERASHQVFVEGTWVDGARPGQPLGLGRTQPYRNRLGDRARHLRLEREHVAFAALIALGPEIALRVG